METFSTRQTAVIAATNKIVYWIFRVVDTADNVYYWSTGTVSSTGNETISVGALESPGVYTDREWQRAHTFKIVNFSGITLRRNKTETGIHAPNDVTFTIVNSSNTLTASAFKGCSVRIGLVVDDGSGRELVGSWRFIIKSASPYNQQIDVVCEDFLQQYLKGSYPNTQYASQIFPSKDNLSDNENNICVPEPYGTCYIPLRSVYAVDDRYYLLGDTTNTYTITEVRSPRQLGPKIAWTSAGYTFTQATKADAAAVNWRVFQPIIADSNLDGVADASGIWLAGDKILDMPTKFSRSDTSSVTSPADIIKYVLRNMGVLDDDLDLASFDTAKTTFTSWSLAWNFAFWYKEDRTKVLSKLLVMCHSCLIVGEKIKLQVLSKTSQKTITEVEVIKPEVTGPSSFRYIDAIAEKNSDSGYVAWQQTGESQDEFIRTLVAAKSSTDTVDSEAIELPGIQDSQQAQKLGTLYYQRKFLKAADVAVTIKGTSLALRPDDVITMNYADFGGSYAVLINDMTINQDASIDIRCIKFSESLDDWADLAPSAITVAAASSSGAYSPIIVGPDSPSSSPLPNILPGRLRIGSTSSYILLTPTSPERISLYISDVEKFRLGDLNGYLGVVAQTYGFGFGSSAASQANLIWDVTNGLRLRTATTNVFSVDNSGNAYLQSSLTLGKTGVSSGTLTLQLNDGAGDTYIAAGKTDFTNVDAGFILGLDDSDSNKAKFYVGDSTNYINWTGTALNIAGSISASTIDIGGADATSFHVDADGNMWLGAALFANGVFKVSNAGAVTATSGTIGGWTLAATTLTGTGVTLSSTGDAYLSFGTTPPTAPTTGTGIFINKTGLFGLNANNQRFKILEDGSGFLGAATTIAWTNAGVVTVAGFTLSADSLYTGTKTAYNDANAGVHFGTDGIGIGNNVFTVSSAGALVATSATITGAITATSGKFGTTTNYWSVGATGLTAVSASTDVIINYGKTDFTNVETGFILGYDFSATAAKFYIGDSTQYLNWDGSALTYTKGTLAETIIQMYTNVATLKTSATAGDGSADSAGMVLTYEGLFGCGASQTATIAAANANVRILATGAAFFKGAITADTGYIGGTSGWVISANYIKDVAGVVGLSSVVTAGDDIRFWAGHATPASAPFYVTEAGVLVATSATISGSLTAGNTIIANNDINFTEDIVTPSMMIWGGNTYFGSSGSVGSISTKGIFCTGGYIYILTAYNILTYSQAAGVLSRVSNFGIIDYGTGLGIWGNGTYIYVVTSTKLLSFSTSSGILTLVDSYALTSGLSKDVWAKNADNYVYIANDTIGVQSFSVTDGVFALVDTEDLDGANYSVFGDGTYLYALSSGAVLRAFSIVAGVLTSVDTDATASGTVVDLFCQGGFIFVVTNGDIFSFTFDGANITYKNTSNILENAAGITGDGTYIYVLDGNTTLGIQSFSIDGAGAFTAVDTETTIYSGSTTPIGFDGTYLIVAGYNTSIAVVSVNTLSLAAGVMTKVDNDDISNIGISIYPNTTLTSNFFIGYDILTSAIKRMYFIKAYCAELTIDATINQYFKINTVTKMTISSTNILLEGNLGLGGQTTFGTSAAKVIGLASGTAPTTAPTNMGQLWCEDINAAAGYSGWHMMVETNAIKLIVPGVYIKGTTGQIANPFESLIEINTFDNTLKMYCDAGWRSLATW